MDWMREAMFPRSSRREILGISGNQPGDLRQLLLNLLLRYAIQHTG
jgi:hypothetical protein